MPILRRALLVVNAPTDPPNGLKAMLLSVTLWSLLKFRAVGSPSPPSWNIEPPVCPFTTTGPTSLSPPRVMPPKPLSSAPVISSVSEDVDPDNPPATTSAAQPHCQVCDALSAIGNVTPAPTATTPGPELVKPPAPRVIPLPSRL